MTLVVYAAGHEPFDDINHNYLIGQDGVVYEGRGYTRSAAVYEWNWSPKIITIAFLGSFTESVPNEDSMFVTQCFLQYLVDKGMCSTCTLYMYV